MKKLLIGGVSVAALAGGSFALATLSPIQFAGAAKNTPSVEVQAGQSPGTTQPGQDQQGSRGNGHRGPRGGGLEKALDDLVKDGTITQAQADKIKEKLKTSGGPGRGGPGRGQFGGAGLDEVAASIGITQDQLKTELKSGSSIAEVAQAHGVDPKKVINDLVVAATKKIDEAVASGKLPADKAAKAKERLTQRITDLVNAKHGGGRGPGGKHDDGNSTDGPNGGGPDNSGGNGGSNTTAPPSTSAPTTAAPTTAAPTTAAPTTSAPATTAAPATGGTFGGGPGGSAGGG